MPRPATDQEPTANVCSPSAAVADEYGRKQRRQSIARRYKTLAASRLAQSLVLHEPVTTSRLQANDKIAYTDLDPRCWKDESSDIILDSLWLFPSRDKSGAHCGDYHGNFIPQVPNQVIRRYTRPSEVVVDLFSGSGTTLIETRNLGRHGIGVDLQEEANLIAQQRLDETPNPHDTTQRLITGASGTASTRNKVQEALNELGVNQAHHVILHPPYWDIILFSGEEDSQDLSSATTEDDFYEAFKAVACNAYDILQPGRFLTLVIGDKYTAGQWIPLGFGCMEVCRRLGLVLKSINVKDIQGNEKGKGSTTNLWKYRAMKGGFYLFKHEYVMIFQKPSKTKPRRANSTGPRLGLHLPG